MFPSDSSEDTERTSFIPGGHTSLFAKPEGKPHCLVVVRGPSTGARFQLDKAQNVLGRDPSADIVLNDKSVSRQHACISFKNGLPHIRDLGSTNGTRHNDQMLDEGANVPLEHDDYVKAGIFLLKFLHSSAVDSIFIEELTAAARTDSVTGIFNRGSFIEALDAGFSMAKSTKRPFSLVLMDLDHFKKINDTYGHDAGDLVLREFASLVQANSVRRPDIFARYGGEEFVLLLPGTAAPEAVKIAEAIRRRTEEASFNYKGQRIPVTVSLGVSQVSHGVESPESLFKLGDSALYASKNAGRNRVTLSP